MRTCPNCRETFDDSVNFCFNDGTPLTDNYISGFPAPVSYPVRRQSQLSPLAVASFITLAVLVGGGILAFGAIIYFSKSFNRTGSHAQPESTPARPVNISSNDGKPANDTSQFAREVFRFGSEGVGAGQFQSIRSLTVDPTGKIYVGEGERPARVQIFDSTGKFLTQWTAPDKEAYLTKLAADRNGAVYAIQGFSLVRLDGATGKQTAEIVKTRYGTFNHDDPLEFIANDMAVALDNTLWVLVGNGTFLHFDSDGKLLGKVKNAPKLASYDGRFKQIAVDGAGNIYAISSNDCYIFRFSSEGRFLNRFVGKSGGANVQPGQCFISFRDIAVDGKGRVYVTDSNQTGVFDGDGKLINSFKAKDALFNLIFTDKNELWASTGKSLVRFEVNQ